MQVRMSQLWNYEHVSELVVSEQEGTCHGRMGRGEFHHCSDAIQQVEIFNDSVTLFLYLSDRVNQTLPIFVIDLLFYLVIF